MHYHRNIILTQMKVNIFVYGYFNKPRMSIIKNLGFFRVLFLNFFFFTLAAVKLLLLLLLLCD